jgi:hypothetical protein
VLSPITTTLIRLQLQIPAITPPQSSSSIHPHINSFASLSLKHRTAARITVATRVHRTYSIAQYYLIDQITPHISINHRQYALRYRFLRCLRGRRCRLSCCSGCYRPDQARQLCSQRLLSQLQWRLRDPGHQRYSVVDQALYLQGSFIQCFPDHQHIKLTISTEAAGQRREA